MASFGFFNFTLLITQGNNAASVGFGVSVSGISNRANVVQILDHCNSALAHASVFGRLAPAWSRFWGWDPKETAALATWLIYAVYLHARSQRGWQGRPAALLLVIGFLAVLVTYSGNLWFSGLHTYSGLPTP